ncbi:MAG: phosphoglycerate dehydrogenase [Desulfuromonas sp.]|mgnify:CR=1 FL=1|nr:MAG: phosphoglycerate dehydrogenase [Desulfuromonas sp.]
MTQKVLVADRLSQPGLDIFKQADGIELIYQPDLTHEQLLAAVADVEALVVRSGTHLTGDVFRAAPKLRVIGRAGIGTENIDLNAANRKGLVVMNTPFGSAITSAEHTIAMLLALARNIPQATRSIKQGRWEKNLFLGIEISGKTLGVIGAGKIGQLVIERALGLRMRILVYDPYLSTEAVQQLGAEQVELDALRQQADFITLHVPLTPETNNLIDCDFLAHVKPGCRIINCAQGGLVDETALEEAIKADQVAGAALDVFSKEPPPADLSLLQMEQVICTPHLRAASSDAQVNVAVQIAHQIVDFLQHGIIVNALNMPSVSADLLAEVRPYLQLSERMGHFIEQYCACGLEAVTLEYSGGIVDHPTGSMTAAFLKGLLSPMLGDDVNYVNAALLAEERGIRVTEARSKTADEFASMIRVRVTGKTGEHSISGAVFGETDYRLVRIDSYPVEAVPAGPLLVLHNQDQPGVIGGVGQVLAEAGVNIAMMNLSRRKINGRAISLIGLDGAISENVMHQLEALQGVISAVLVTLPDVEDTDTPSRSL